MKRRIIELTVEVEGDQAHVECKPCIKSLDDFTAAIRALSQTIDVLANHDLKGLK